MNPEHRQRWQGGREIFAGARDSGVALIGVLQSSVTGSSMDAEYG